MGRDTITLEQAVSIISQEYLQLFCSDYFIPESLHPELPGLEDAIVNFPEGKINIYCKFFEFTNYRIPVTQFLFDLLGHYQIHLSQLSVIGWMSFAKHPRKDTPQCYVKPLDSLKNWNNRFFWVDERVFPTPVAWRSSAPRDNKPTADSYSEADVATLNTHRTSFGQQPEDLLCLVGISRNYFFPEDQYPMFLYDNDQGGDGSIWSDQEPEPQDEGRYASSCCSRGTAVASHRNSGGKYGRDTHYFNFDRDPSAMEKSPLDFADEDVQTDVMGEHQTDNPISTTVPQREQPAAESAATEVPLETNLEQEVLTMGPPINKRRRKRDRGETGSNAPSKVLRTERGTAADTQSVSEPEPLSFAVPRPTPEPDVAQSSKTAAVEDEDTEKSSSFTSMGGPPDDIYQPSWGITNSCRLDNPLVCQELVDHIIPPGCFSEMRHLPSEDFLSQYNINLARQVALGSQLRLRFEQESKLLKKSVAKIGRREQKIQVQDDKIKNLESLIEAESDMKRAAEAKNETLTKELEDLRAHFSKLQVDSEQLTQQVATLQAQVTGEEKIKAAFEEFKQLEDKRVEQRCAEMDARLDALSIDFDEELYPHMLTAIAGRRWMIGHGLRLAVMKCAESMELRQAFADVVTAGIAKGLSDGLRDGVEHGKAGLDLASLEGHDPEANEKFTAALQALKDLKYPLVDELEQLKDAPIDCIMASLHLESDTGEDAPPEVRNLGPCTSQLKIPVYPEVRDPRNPWAVRKEILLEDAIATNISRAEKKKKSRVVCRTHGVSSAHHARSDGVPVSVPVVPQGLQIVLMDASTQTDLDKDNSPRRLARASFVPLF
ncbi:hypothetical protein Tco_0749780 [Tanacetum coccineum]|uniref:Transposase (Putative), gypsy type n=1 Tax=Tanacetum coccineum TaxID=301880 RepID=A0ABQ4YZD6_9ASTR